MTTLKSRNRLLAAVATFGGSALAIYLIGVTPGAALNNGLQLLSGGGLVPPFTTLYTSPGLAALYNVSPNLGESAAQLRMQPGTLSHLRVKVTSSLGGGVSGRFTITVRVNGVNTPLTCFVRKTGNCSSPAGASVTLTNTSLLSIRATNNLEEGGDTAFTYALIYD